TRRAVEPKQKSELPPGACQAPSGARTKAGPMPGEPGNQGTSPSACRRGSRLRTGLERWPQTDPGSPLDPGREVRQRLSPRRLGKPPKREESKAELATAKRMLEPGEFGGRFLRPQPGAREDAALGAP